MEQTLLLIKPDIVEKNMTGAVITAFEEKGIVIKDIKMETFTKERAEGFYEIHKGKPFFDNLLEFMISGPILEVILECENCVEYVREIIGNTNPKKAEAGTIRRRFGSSVTENAVHASDSVENARKEIAYIFGDSSKL